MVDQTIIEPGLIITNQQGISNDGTVKTETTFNTTNDDVNNAHIKQDLVETVESNYDNGTNSAILAQIKDYAGKIKCDDFHERYN